MKPRAPSRTLRLRWIARIAAAGAAAWTSCSPAIAAADEPTTTWSARYEIARQHMVGGDYRVAEREFIELASAAPNEQERRLAVEMARIAANWADGRDASWPALEPKPATIARRTRTRDELTLLYATSFVYGVGTATWFLLQTRPNTALTATLPFIGITAAPALTLAIIDASSPLPRGVPHAISAGTYVGLGESFLIVSYQHARARRVGGARWRHEDSSTVLWGGATLGAIAGGVLAVGVPTTPGRASFTASAALWGGVLSGLAVGALIPETEHRTEHSLLGAGVGYNVGVLGGLMTSASVAPSTTRVRLLDLSGIAGALVLGGGYVAAHGSDSRITMAMAGSGAATGLVVGWFATKGMLPDSSAAPNPRVQVQPSLTPVPGGAAIGVAGSL